MSDTFAQLLKNRKKNSQKMAKKIEELQTKKSYDDGPDETFWTLSHLRGDDGNGKATIRLLPPSMGDDEPFKMYLSYFQKNKKTGKWYVHASHHSYDKDLDDPAYDYNGKIYGNESLTDDEKKKLTIRRQKHYVWNIRVIDDPAEPSNNGKVFKFDMGPQIFKLIMDRKNTNPPFDDDEYVKCDPWDAIEGCDLKIKIISKTVERIKMPDYSSSTFGPISPMADTEEEMEAIWKQQYDLKYLVDPENKMYKPVAKQKADLAAWLGEESDEDDEPVREEANKTTKKEKVKDKVKSEPEPDEDDEESLIEDDEDEDDFFSKFSNDEDEDDGIPY